MNGGDLTVRLADIAKSFDLGADRNKAVAEACYGVDPKTALIAACAALLWVADDLQLAQKPVANVVMFPGGRG